MFRFWEFIDGYYLSEKGIDLYTLFQELPADRTMNILDSIVVEESIRDAKLNGAVEKARTQITKLNGWGVSTPINELDGDITEYDPEAGYTVQSRDAVTGSFDEGMKVHNPSTFRLEPPKDGSSDSPFA